MLVKTKTKDQDQDRDSPRCASPIAGTGWTPAIEARVAALVKNALD